MSIDEKINVLEVEVKFEALQKAKKLNNKEIAEIEIVFEEIKNNII